MASPFILKVNCMKKSGFTLAEVLITLGIIGVVAALTIPTLMTTISAKVKASRIEVVTKKIDQGTSLLNINNGIGPYYNNTMEFVQALAKHLKITQICDSNNLTKCFPYTSAHMIDGSSYNISNLRTGLNLGLTSGNNTDYTSPNVGIILADGTPMILNYNLKCPISNPDDSKNTSSCIIGIYDLNGAAGPNKMGKDIVGFNGGGLGAAFVVNGVKYSAPFTPVPEHNEELEEYFGTSEASDYWMGASDQCNGRLPDREDLEDIARVLYNTDNFTDEDGFAYADSLRFDENSEIAQAIGLKPPFYIWSNEMTYETVGKYELPGVKRALFGKNDYSEGSIDPAESSTKAICVIP